MHVNHVNLPTIEIAKTKAFLEAYFGLHSIQEDEKIAVLTDDKNSVVTLSNFNQAQEIVYPSAFHIGFMQPSRADVDAMFERLTKDGHEVGRPKELHGAWTFYFKPPGASFLVEVLHQHNFG